MKALAQLLSTGVVDRPVVDLTGLNGAYEVAVDITADEAMKVAQAAVPFLPLPPLALSADPAGYSIFKSVRNPGLKLDARKLPLDTLAIDRLEKTPIAN